MLNRNEIIFSGQLKSWKPRCKQLKTPTSIRWNPYSHTIWTCKNNQIQSLNSILKLSHSNHGTHNLKLKSRAYKRWYLSRMRKSKEFTKIMNLDSNQVKESMIKKAKTIENWNPNSIIWWETTKNWRGGLVNRMLALENLTKNSKGCRLSLKSWELIVTLLSKR